MKLFILCLIIPVYLFAEQSSKEQFDSLKIQLLESQEDTNRVKVLYNIAMLYTENSSLNGFKNNPDTGLYYGMEALRLAEKLSFEEGKYYSKVYLGRILWRMGKFSLAVKYHLEALGYAEKFRPKDAVGFISTFLAQDYADDGKYDTALFFLQYAKSAYTYVKDTSAIANTLLLMSWVYSSKGNFPEAAKTNLEALRLYEATHDEYGTAIASSNTAIDFYKLGKYSEAIHYLKIAIGIYSKYKDAVNTIGNYISLSNIFIDQNNYTEAMKNAWLALTIAKTSNDAISLGSCYSKIAEIYSLKNNYDSAALNQELKLSPTELVNEIHTCFKAFDDIIGKYGIEKIKTIGDIYMCAGGLPVKNTSHAADVVNAALEIRQFMQQHLQERKSSNKEIFEIRIGIHTGPIVAGIVGVKKFAYDIWGDTVNIASRMEQNSEPGKINISASTYAIIKNKFNCTYRGKIHAKNKGEIDMYFVV